MQNATPSMISGQFSAYGNSNTFAAITLVIATALPQAIKPKLCDFHRFGVEVIMQRPARGATMLDQRNGDVRVATNVQTLAFHALMQACLLR